MKKLVAVLSGGIDSAVAMALCLDQPDLEVVHAVSFWYRQRHSRELSAARNIRDWYDVPGRLVSLAPAAFAGASALIRHSPAKPPLDRSLEEMTTELASTFVPGRNLIFISYAAAIAYNLGADGIVGGWHWDDSSGYPDCHPGFLTSAELTVRLALDKEFYLHRPLIGMSKSEIIAAGRRLQVPFDMTWSCYYGRDKACGRCDACLLRLKGFQAAGSVDPIEYEEEK